MRTRFQRSVQPLNYPLGGARRRHQEGGSDADQSDSRCVEVESGLAQFSSSCLSLNLHCGVPTGPKHPQILPEVGTKKKTRFKVHVVVLTLVPTHCRSRLIEKLQRALSEFDQSSAAFELENPIRLSKPDIVVYAKAKGIVRAMAVQGRKIENLRRRIGPIQPTVVAK